MAVRKICVVLVREKGLFLVVPAEGKSQNDAILAALNLSGGYSAGNIDVDLPEGATEAWVAWVEGTEPAGKPYFVFRVFDSSLSQAEVESALDRAGEAVLKLNRSQVHRAT